MPKQKNLYDQILDLLYDKNFDFDAFKNKLNELGINWPSIKQDYNKIFNDGVLINVAPNGDCAFNSSLIAFGYDIDENKMLKLRQDVAEYTGDETIKEKGTWYNNVKVLECLSKQENNKPYGYVNRERLEDEILKTLSEEQLKAMEYRMEPNRWFKYLNIGYVPFKDFINGCPFTVLINNNHYETLKPDSDIRKKIVLDFYDLVFKNAIHDQINLNGAYYPDFRYQEKSPVSYFIEHVVYLFAPFQNYSEQDDEDDFEWNKLCDEFEEHVRILLDEISSSDEDKKIKILRLIFFLYQQYRKKVIEPLNFEIKTEDFLKELMDDFKYRETENLVCWIFGFDIDIDLNFEKLDPKPTPKEIINKILSLSDKQKQDVNNYLHDNYDPDFDFLDLDPEVAKLLIKNGIFNFFYFANYADKPDLQLLCLENLSLDEKKLWQEKYLEDPSMFSSFDERVLKKLSELGFDVDNKSFLPELKNKYNKDTTENLYSQAFNNDLRIDDINKNYVGGDCGPYAAKRSLEVYLENNPTPENQKKLADLKSKSISDLRKEVGEYWLKKDGWNKSNEDYIEITTEKSSCEARYFSHYLQENYKIEIVDCLLPNFRWDKKDFDYERKRTAFGNGLYKYRRYRDTFFLLIDGYPTTFYTGGHYVYLDLDKDKRKDFFIKTLRFALYSRMFYDFNQNDLVDIIYNLESTRTESYIFNKHLGLFFEIDENTKQKILNQIKNYLDQMPLKSRVRKTFELIEFMYNKFIDLVIEPEDRNITAEEFLSKVLEAFKTENLDKDQDIKEKLDADKNKETKKNTQEHDEKNKDYDENETKKLVDELIDWDDDKDCFKTNVQRQMDIILKLNDKQKAYLKDYFVDKNQDGDYYLLMFDSEIIKQLVKDKIFPYEFFYLFRQKPELQMFILESINDDQNLKKELVSDNYNIDISMCRESVLNKFKEVTGLEVDLKMSYESLIKAWNKDMYTQNHQDLYNNYTFDVKADGNCVFYSLIQAYENIKLEKKDYNDELKQKIINLRKEAAEDYKQNYEQYGDTKFNYDVYESIREYGKSCPAGHVAIYFAKKYNRPCFLFCVSDQELSETSPYLQYFKPHKDNKDNDKNVKDLLTDFINRTPCIVANYQHCKTLNFNMNRDQRKEFIAKFLRLRFSYEVCWTLLSCEENYNPTSLDCVLNKRGLDFLFGIDENQKLELKKILVSYFDAVPEKYRARKIFEFRKFMIEKFIELVIKPENKNITAEKFLSRALDDFRIENLAKEQDFDIDMRKKFAGLGQEMKNPTHEDNKTQNQTQTQTEKPNQEKIEPAENIDPKPNQSIELVLTNSDEIDLNLVRNSMLFVSALLGEKQAYEFISKMSDAELKNFYEKNKTKINDMAKKIRDDGEVKKFLGQNIDVLDIIKLDKSQLESLNNKLNKQNLKEWTLGLAGGWAVSISLGIAAVCTFFPVLAIASGAIALPTLVLTCYKSIKSKIRQSKKSRILNQLKLITRDKNFLGMLGDIKNDERVK